MKFNKKVSSIWLKNIRLFFNVMGQGLIIAIIVICIVCPLSCHITAEGIEFVGGDYVAPKLQSYNVIDNRNLKLDFSESVKLSCITVIEKNHLEKNETYSSLENFKNEDYSNVKILNGTNGNEIIINFENPSEIGKSYILGGIVEDKYGNSLTFSLPFTGFNSRIPKVIITEILPIHKTVKKDIEIVGEYVEIMALEDGNLFGLAVGSAGIKEENDYMLPPVEVKKGEIIIIHLRNQGNGCISEDGNNLDLAKAKHCMDGVRDLWTTYKGGSISDPSDVVYVKDVLNNKYVEGVAYHHDKETKWNNDKSLIAKSLHEAGVLKSDKLEDSVVMGSKSTANSLQRVGMADLQNKLLQNIDFDLGAYNKWVQKGTDPGYLTL